ncbi:UDP-N-acetylenolpyruvoylglucosamine reductase [Candidatus Nomurabacteria bacterium RIFCSPHIGHO2_02_FULL_35_13]|uniref:UDP-N-acetylenolpyruvoylglucosamine reductase n=1 Tax=Candidatus Nomurabacteria bacterium RIFCSPHIGHO2_02_FULL_35_13 TaxID=1801748 RepID=A0A1F6VNW3_9BACT|nr:MAG: UDP-N-acetylenolpyruvoylglucosamine reductase [Candidatus Nomurabacteria bacterium RIFCSPHIGHO2_02_FULL_35_13]
MKIIQNYDLKKLNTFGISARAKFFIEIQNELDLKELFKLPEFKDNEKLFLGGGSNILFMKDFNGIVILNKLKGIEILEENSEYVVIRSMGGEIWHDLIIFAVNRGYWGIENLSLIPGTVGAAPMQNIGAYGVELKDTLENVEAYDIKTGEKRIFKKNECKFDYRYSIFKDELKSKYFISAITLKLSKIEKKNINYKILQEYLEKNKIEIKNSKDISDAVAYIRKSKLPDPVLIGNAGSFFKNIFVTNEKMESFLSTYPEMPYFKEPADAKAMSGKEENIKIPASWLIEKCGWKGKRIGNVGVHEKQALVLVNYGGATGEEVKNLSEQIITSVFSKFGLTLEREVNLI